MNPQSSEENSAIRQRGFVHALRGAAQDAHDNSRSKGFWAILDRIRALEDKEFAAQLELLWKLSRIALMHSELSESVEGIRKGLADDHLPHRSMEVAEMADTVIRILDYAGADDLPLGETIVEKMEYNRGRPYLHGKKI